jgi:DNA-directed RNA polymerase specialized sigma24 family protein
MNARASVLPLPRRPIAAPRRDRRAAVARALSACAAGERVLLALLLFERLTPAEAASVLGVPAPRVERAYVSLLSQLRQSLRGRGATRAWRGRPAGAPRFATPGARLRRAS